MWWLTLRFGRLFVAQAEYTEKAAIVETEINLLQAEKQRISEREREREQILHEKESTFNSELARCKRTAELLEMENKDLQTKLDAEIQRIKSVAEQKERSLVCVCCLWLE